MSTLVNNITSVVAALYGVSILEEQPPGGVQGVGTNIVATLGLFPWGPEGSVQQITSPAQLFDTFAPLPFDVLNSYDALKAFIGKTFPSVIKVVRVAATSAAAATQTFLDSTAGNSVVVTARYKGVVGDQISVAFSANATTAANRDMTVSIGTRYTATYENVVVDDTGSITVADPGDPYVTIVDAGSATDVPDVIAATSLASGSDGAAIAGDVATAVDLYGSVSETWNVLFVAGCPSGLVDSTNAKLKSFFDTHSRGFGILCTPDGATAAETQTDAASYRTDRLHYPWPRVNITNKFDPDRALTEVDGNSFAAVALASIAPELSPGGAGGSAHLKGIVSLETGATKIELEALNAAGVAPFIISRELGGAAIHRGVTTSLTAGLTKTFRRRMTDYLVDSIGAFLARYVGRPLDLDLSTSTLGPVTGSEIGQIRGFLQDLLDTGRIRAYSVDPFGGNLQSNIDAGQWFILVSVKLVSMQEEIILRALIGEGVTVDAA